ncbi:MAG TPA: DUF5689 domain-containing protein [Saprospiraceae bacterium]|nr:DUF5689 domain-containing protein [Saprospiraceae bacterium]
MQKLNRILYFFLAILCIAPISCVDREFDEPPQKVSELPFNANSSILELKSKYQTNKFVDITDDLLIHAVVVADDKSGNFYKTIVVQDSTGGIEIKLNRTGLFNDFPVGMKIGIKCKGLTIGAYNNLIQLGKGTTSSSGSLSLAQIEDAVISQYIFKGPKNQFVTPKKTSIGALGSNDLSTLVQLDGVEFASSANGKTYADAVGQSNVNLDLVDCKKNSIILRSSGFSNFAGVVVPSGNGVITAILSVYRTDLQLYIRDTSDVKLTGPTCNGGGGSGTETLINILDVRKLFTGTTSSVPADKKIKGIVISDKDPQNIVSQNVQIQDATGGVTVRFDGNHSFALNDEIEIIVSGAELSEFNGLLQINNVPLGNAKKTGTGTVSPKLKTIAEIKANFENLESSLIKISGATITKLSGTTYSGTCIISDPTGVIDLFTRTAASFAGDNFPTGTSDIVAIVTQGGTSKAQQISIRNKTDVVNNGGGGGGSTAVDSFQVNFEGMADNSVIGLSGWKNEAVKGTRTWLAKVFSGNVYAQATAFNDQATEMETWLITPKINGKSAKTFNFESAKAFYKHDGLKVMISTNFDGSNITAASWVPLTVKLAGQADADHAFVPSGDVDLSSFTTDYYIAFVYTGDKATNTTSYRVDNIRLKLK